MAMPKLAPQAPVAHDKLRALGILALNGMFDEMDALSVLRYAVIHDLNVGRSADETLRVIQALQTGGLCQADWRPGQETLKVG